MVPLDVIVDVTVEVSNPTSIVSDFNLGLIIGDSKALGSDTRTKVYSKTNYATQMVADGFTTASPEYLAVVAYFGQTPSPANVVVGVKLTDEANSETDVQAFTACRTSNQDFYAVSFAYETTDANMAAVAAAVEASAIPTVFFYQTKDIKVTEASTDNIMKTMSDSKYNRTCGFYSTQTNFINAVMGLYCGMNSMLPNSAYTFAYKVVAGYVAEEIDSVQLSNIQGYNGNTYAQFGRRYSFTYPGVMASGYHVDEQYMIDAIKFLIQQNTVAGLISRRQVPQTDQGVTDIISFVTDGCETLRTMGFVDTGIWTGGQVLNLMPGDAVPGGYMIQAGSLADQSAQDRKNRISPPIYVALKSAGAIEHVVVRVFVNQ